MSLGGRMRIMGRMPPARYEPVSVLSRRRVGGGGFACAGLLITALTMAFAPRWPKARLGGGALPARVCRLESSSACRGADAPTPGGVTDVAADRATRSRCQRVGWQVQPLRSRITSLSRFGGMYGP